MLYVNGFILLGDGSTTQLFHSGLPCGIISFEFLVVDERRSLDCVDSIEDCSCCTLEVRCARFLLSCDLLTDLTDFSLSVGAWLCIRLS
jgi:hypothetical protein